MDAMVGFGRKERAKGKRDEITRMASQGVLERACSKIKMARVELVENGRSWSGGDDDLSSKYKRGNIETAVQVYFDYQNNKRQLLFCFFQKVRKKRHQKEIKTKPPTISIMKQTRNI